MTFTIPVSPHDIHLLRGFADVLLFLGGLQKHTLIFCPTPSVAAQVSPVAAELRAVCPNVFVDICPRDHDKNGRFGAPNQMFRDIVELLAKRGNASPWMWMELDVRPIRAGWADRLELEYNRAGKPFMGIRRKASDVMRTKDGAPLPQGDDRAHGDYMVGVGIYPANFKDYSVMYKHPDPSGAMPFDVTIRHEVNRHLHHTPIIEHRYKTGNYRREGEAIVCDNHEYSEGWPDYSGTLNDLAFLVHGCKDDSLDKIVLSGTQPESKVASIVEGSAEPEIARLRAENEQLRKELEAVIQKNSAKESSYLDEIESLQEQLAKSPLDTSDISAADKAMRTAVGLNEPEITEKPVPTVDVILKALTEAKKSVKLHDLAADFGCNKLELRKVIETPGSGIKIAPGGLAWVSIAA